MMKQPSQYEKANTGYNRWIQNIRCEECPEIYHYDGKYDHEVGRIGKRFVFFHLDNIDYDICFR